MVSLASPNYAEKAIFLINKSVIPKLLQGSWDSSKSWLCPDSDTLITEKWRPSVIHTYWGDEALQRVLEADIYPTAQWGGAPKGL